jgi:formylglycine-generating enzyme required for sulfatase activity
MCKVDSARVRTLSWLMRGPGDWAAQGQVVPRDVVIPSPFQIDAFEVTFDRWAACVASGACMPSSREGEPGQPVSGVTLAQAMAFCRWAGGVCRRRTCGSWRGLARRRVAIRGGIPGRCAVARTGGGRAGRAPREARGQTGLGRSGWTEPPRGSRGWAGAWPSGCEAMTGAWCGEGRSAASLRRS